jgi:hypothetical protein
MPEEPSIGRWVAGCGRDWWREAFFPTLVRREADETD